MTSSRWQCESYLMYIFLCEYNVIFAGTAYYTYSIRDHGLTVQHVSCYGTETRLSDCTYTSNEDTHFYDEVGVSCNLGIYL